jgi:2-C-methyl-D-erythritol 4-phosphate cytidylyltransferase
MVSCHFLIPAAGVGKRMGLGYNKLLIERRGKTILEWTLQAAELAQSVVWIGVIGHDRDQAKIAPLLAKMTKPTCWIRGGETRQESVFNGLQSLPATATYVLIHDGARCLITPDLIDRCAQGLLELEALVCAVPVKDTIKVVKDGQILHTPDRSQLWSAQTPQAFRVPTILHAHQVAKSRGWTVTDDSALVEKLGIPVGIVEGEETNIKITTPQDLLFADRVLEERYG